MSPVEMNDHGNVGLKELTLKTKSHYIHCIYIYKKKCF